MSSAGMVPAGPKERPDGWFVQQDFPHGHARKQVICSPGQEQGAPRPPGSVEMTPTASPVA